MRTLTIGLAILIPLAGCAAAPARVSNPFALPGVDDRSAAAGVVTEAGRTRYAYPNLRRLPPALKDVRPNPAWGQAAAELRGGRDRLLKWGADNPPEAANTEAYAGRTLARMPDRVTEAPPEDQAQRSADWAARAKAAAQPPPPPPSI